MEKLTEFWIEAGEVIHYKGVPLLVAMGCRSFGNPQNVKALNHEAQAQADGSGE